MIGFKVNVDARVGALAEFDQHIEMIKSAITKTDTGITNIAVGLHGENVAKYVQEYVNARDEVAKYVDSLISLSSELEKQKLAAIQVDDNLM